MSWLRRFFRLDELNTSVGTEIRGGAVTFVAMAYIIFVQPIILSSAPGMEADEVKAAVMVATCISSAVAIFLMGLLANYPIALAPAMGHNIFFAVTVCLVMKIPWQTALGAVFISGCLFMVLSLFALRERVMAAVPGSLKNAIAVGIGLMIAWLGLSHAGLALARIDLSPALQESLGAPFLEGFFAKLKLPATQVAILGLVATSILMALKTRGAVLIGMAITAIVGIVAGVVPLPGGVVSAPPSLSPTLFKLDIAGALSLNLITVIFVFFFLDLFDTVGTLIGVSEQAGFLREGKLPRARQALFADAVGTVVGATLGTSTVTSYIESTAGVSDGARSGLANMMTGLLFVLAIFFSPIAAMVGKGCVVGTGLDGAPAVLYPVTAPILILIGCLMMAAVKKIAWDDLTEAIPCFLCIIIMPIALSITDGIAFGFISYAVLKLVRRRGREVSWLIYLFSVLFIIRYIWLKG